jgi:hypothetical protein
VNGYSTLFTELDDRHDLRSATGPLALLGDGHGWLCAVLAPMFASGLAVRDRNVKGL